MKTFFNILEISIILFLGLCSCMFVLAAIKSFSFCWIILAITSGSIAAYMAYVRYKEGGMK